MKKVIGLVGEKGGGKGKFKDILVNLIHGKIVKHVRFSDVLVETLNIWNIKISRENLQKLSPLMVDAYGEGILTKAVLNHITKTEADVIILDGVRWPSDVVMLQEFPDSVLVYVTADAKIRHARSKLRKEKAGEENTTFKQFMKEEEAETEKSIPKIGAAADVKISNNGSPEELYEQIKHFCDEYLS